VLNLGIVSWNTGLDDAHPRGVTAERPQIFEAAKHLVFGSPVEHKHGLAYGGRYRCEDCLASLLWREQATFLDFNFADYSPEPRQPAP